MTELDRLNKALKQAFLDINIFKKADMANFLGYKGPYFSGLINGKIELNETFYEKISDKLGVNITWVKTGEGPMLKTEPKPPVDNKETINLKNDDEMTNNMLVTMLYDANQRIKRLEAEIEELKQQQGDATDSQKKRGAI